MIYPTHLRIEELDLKISPEVKAIIEAQQLSFDVLGIPKEYLGTQQATSQELTIKP